MNFSFLSRNHSYIESVRYSPVPLSWLIHTARKWKRDREAGLGMGAMSINMLSRTVHIAPGRDREWDH